MTFTRQACPDGQAGQQQQVTSQKPGSISYKASSNQKDSQPPALTVIGGTDDGCGNRLGSRERRQAIIRQQIRPGMTVTDVENALGKPERRKSRNSQLTYYYSRNRNSRTVAFDQHGCVRTAR